MDATAMSWVLSPVPMTNPKQAVGFTLQQIYNAQKQVKMVMFNW